MTEEVAKEENEMPAKKIFAEGRGRYTLIDNAKVFNFEFPLTCTLEENFAAIAFIKEEILKTIQSKEDAEKEKLKDEEKTSTDDIEKE